MPLTITPRSVGTTNATSVSAKPIAATAQIVRSNVSVVSTAGAGGSVNSNSIVNVAAAAAANNLSSATINALPVAKVLPQQQNVSGSDGIGPAIVSVSANVGGQSVFIHSRSPSGVTATPVVASNNASSLHGPNSQNTISYISSASGAYYVPASSVHSNANSNNSSNSNGSVSTSTPNIVQLSSITTTTGSVTTTNATSNANNSTGAQIIGNAPATSIAYAPQAGSFAVVPSSNRITHGPVHGKGKHHTVTRDKE